MSDRRKVTGLRGAAALSGRWRLGIFSVAVLAAVLLLLAGAAQRQPALVARLRPSGAPLPPAQPACTMADLDGLMEDGFFSWGSWETLYGNSRSAATAASALPVAPLVRPPWLEVERCTLRRFTAAAARHCLAGRPLVMIGDSVTRWVDALNRHMVGLGVALLLLQTWHAWPLAARDCPQPLPPPVHPQVPIPVVDLLPGVWEVASTSAGQRRGALTRCRARVGQLARVLQRHALLLPLSALLACDCCDMAATLVRGRGP